MNEIILIDISYRYQMFGFCFSNQSPSGERKNPPPPLREFNLREKRPPQGPPPRPVLDPCPPHLAFLDREDRERAYQEYERYMLLRQHVWDTKYGEQY